MKSVLLIGLGRFGRHIAEKLNEMGHEVMAVDKDEERVNKVLPMVTDAQIGDSTNAEFMQSLGVDNYDACIVAIGDNFQNSLETAFLLKELGAKKVVSRASMEVQRQFLLRNGADEVVYPEKQLAELTALRHTTDHVLDYIALDSEYGIYDMSVPAEWDGMTVRDLDIRRKYDVNLLALREEGKPSTAVNGDTCLQQGQTILALGRWEDIEKCFRL